MKKKLLNKVFLIGLVASYCFSVSAIAQPSGAIGIETDTAKLVNFNQSINAVGNLLAKDSVIIRPEISGRITEINFSEGGLVEKDQTLIVLDSAIASAELNQAQAALNLSQSQHNRSFQLSQKGFISSQAQDESYSQLQVSKATVDLAQARLDKTTLKAPFYGVIGLRNVSVGDYVSPGQDIVQLESIDMLNVDFRVPEHYLSQVKVGLPISLSFDALPSISRKGVVDAINPALDENGRSILLRARVPNDDLVLRPGLFARVSIGFSNKDVLMVPEASISPAGDSSYIYIVEENIVKKTAVVLGQRQNGMVEITHGLSENDEIAISGIQKIFDGAEIVRIETEDKSESQE